MRNLIKSSMLLIIASFALLGCRDALPSENETNNTNGTIHSMREFLYVGNSSRGEFYKIDIESEAIVDTFGGVESGISGAVTTRDGKKMYITTWGGSPDAVHVFNLETRDMSVVSYSTSHLYTSPEGDVLILAFVENNSQTRVGVIDTQTDLITYLDTLGLRYSIWPAQQCVVDGNGKYLYAATNTGQLIKYHYAENRVERIYEGNYSLGSMVLSSDGNTLYSGAGSVIDLNRGDVIGEIPAIEFAHLAISPDDRFVYLTDPTGKNEVGFLPTAKIMIYDTQSLQVTSEISVHGHVNYLSFTDKIVVTSDGVKAYVSGFRDVFVVDLVNQSTSGVVGFATGFSPTSLSIGTWIN